MTVAPPSSGSGAGAARWSTPCTARATRSSSSRAYTRTRASAEDFCREKGIPLRDRFEDVLADPRHRRRRAGDAAQPARRAGDGRRPSPASTSMSRSRSRSTGRAREAAVAAAQAGRRRAGGRLQPALPSLGGRDPQAPRRRPARQGDVDGRAAHHLDRQFIPADNWRAQPDEAPGGAHHRGRRAFDRPHDRVRRPGARRALHHRPLLFRARRTTPPTSCCASRAAPPGSCSARSRPPPTSASRSTAARGWRRSPSPTCSASASCRSRPWRRPGR